MMKKEKDGVVYILTNPSFPEYVKIGYTANVQERLRSLNRSECIPFAFRVYATYEVPVRLGDKVLHSLIDRLNPGLRAIETFDGKTRTKEFYAMAPEDAYALLESIATISGTKDKLKRFTPEGHEITDEQVAAEVRAEVEERRTPFSFQKCGIEASSKIVLDGHEDVIAIVKDDRQIECQGEIGSLSGLARKLLGTSHPLQGPKYWTYNGKTLDKIREEKEALGAYK